tara:strand:- start:637 stop:909 length:273 start_codon:yes stop_codon:yes gene_type:complete
MNDQANVIPDEDVNYVTIFEFRKVLTDMLSSGKSSEEFKAWVGRVLSDAWEDAHDGLTDEISDEVDAREAEFLAAKVVRQQERKHECAAK